MKKRFSIPENMLGYIFVAPAVLFIVVIALYPILGSLFMSFFDVRLNDQTKNDMYFNYRIDMEKVTEPLKDMQEEAFVREFDKQAKKVDSSKAEEVKNKIASFKSKLLSEKEVKDAFDALYKMLEDGKPITNQNNKIVPISQEKSNQLKSDILKISEKAKTLSTKKNDYASFVADKCKRIHDSAFVTPNFIGIKNYQEILGKEMIVKNEKTGEMQLERAGKATYNTFAFTVISVILELLIGLGMALIINKQFKGLGLVRAAVLVPWAIPTIVSAMMWLFMFDGRTGIMSFLFHKIGIIPDPTFMLTSESGPFISVVLADVWKTFPYIALLLLAGLQAIPRDLYEASSIDGASKVQQFFMVTLPLLKQTLLVTVMFRTMDAFRVFELPYMLTPGVTNETLATLTQSAINTTDFGKASVYGAIMFVLTLMICLMFIKVMGKNALRVSK